MPSRKWKNWPARAYDSLNQAGGLLGIGGIVIAVAGVAFTAPVVIGIGAATVVGTTGYALIKGFPPKLKEPREFVGQKITFTELTNLSEEIIKMGIFGASKSGKSTFQEHAIISNTPNSVTHDLSAAMVALQTNPPRIIALLDGDGKKFSQQFNVVKHANVLFIFLDHNSTNTSDQLINERLQEHDEYLNQLEGYLKEEKDGIISQIHFILNKKDLWQNSQGKQTLLKWFTEIIEKWKNKNLAKKITYCEHSNIYANDINNLMSIIIASK